MSQIFLLPGTDPNSNDIFHTDEMVHVYDLRTLFNSALEAVNGRLTDANVRSREGTYDGIREALLNWTDSDGPGHNHDGVNSARLGPTSVHGSAFDSDIHFLNHAYDAPGNRPYIASGSVLLEWEESTAGAVTMAAPVGFGFDPNVMLPVGQPDIVCSLRYDKQSTIPVNTMYQPFPADVTTHPEGLVTFLIRWRVTGPVVPLDGSIGATWLASGITQMLDSQS